jgi:biopolymer transport protein ExbD
MSMKADTEGKAYDDINVTPMVDLYLVLLLIFIIMTTAGLSGLKVKLITESNATAQAKKKMIAISVTPSGTILYNTAPVSLSELGTRLASDKSRFPEMHVVLRGDEAAQYHGVMDVLGVCAKNDVLDVALATKPLKGQ